MPFNPVTEASKMMVYLKKEEEFCKNALQYMEQENKRLQIEELMLRAAIRIEEMKLEQERIKEENEDDENMVTSSSSASSSKQTSSQNTTPSAEDVTSTTSNSPKGYAYAPRIRSPEAESVTSSITDDRYLEPLLDVSGIKSELLEFDN